MTFSLVTIISPHVLQWLGSPQVWVVTLRGAWALTAGMVGTQILWSWIITVPVTTPLNLQLHILANSSLIQPFGRQRSTSWRCYSSEQWGLGLVKETGADEEISRFSQFQNNDSWRTNLEIVKRRPLCSRWQHCSVAVYRTHLIPVAVAIARTTEICQTQGRAEFGLCEDSFWTWQVLSSPFWGMEIVWTHSHHSWC